MVTILPARGAGQELLPQPRPALAGGAGVQPPDGNTGADCTKLGEVTVLVDWLAYTAPADTPLDDILPGAGELDWVELDYGIHGYKKQLRAGHIALYYDGRPDMGKHLVISGQGCRELESTRILDQDFAGGWSGLAGWVRTNGYHVTRVDLALDDRAGELDLDELESARKRGHVVSRWQKGRTIDGWKSINESDGRTIYFGSRQSNICCRIYDKAAERSARGYSQEDAGEWVRVELEAKGETAGLILDMLAADTPAGEVAAGILRNYLQFKTPAGADTNMRRWPLLASWARFLGDVAKVSLTIAPKTRTLESVKEWVVRQVAPSLALLVKAAGGDLSELTHLAYMGAGRLKPRHLAMLAGGP